MSAAVGIVVVGWRRGVADVLLLSCVCVCTAASVDCAEENPPANPIYARSSGPGCTGVRQRRANLRATIAVRAHFAPCRADVRQQHDDALLTNRPPSALFH